SHHFLAFTQPSAPLFTAFQSTSVWSMRRSSGVLHKEADGADHDGDGDGQRQDNDTAHEVAVVVDRAVFARPEGDGPCCPNTQHTHNDRDPQKAVHAIAPNIAARKP